MMGSVWYVSSRERSTRVTAAAVPPAEETRIIGPVLPPKRIVPDSCQDPPSITTGGASHNVCGGPPSILTFFTLPALWNARNLLSGDQKSVTVDDEPSPPAIARDSSDSNERIQTRTMPSAPVAGNARRRPAGG